MKPSSLFSRQQSTNISTWSFSFASGQDASGGFIPWNRSPRQPLSGPSWAKWCCNAWGTVNANCIYPHNSAGFALLNIFANPKAINAADWSGETEPPYIP